MISLRLKPIRIYNKKQPTLSTQQLKNATKELHNHPNITIKKADKQIFVVLDNADYHSKLQNILYDHTKFKKLNKNPTNQLKSKINKLITADNIAICENTKLPQIISNYKSGYLYKTVKIHKPNHPQHSITSQIFTPIYALGKIIKQLITPYLPSEYNRKWTLELIHILHTLKPSNGILASLDVENLFTYVPIKQTFYIQTDSVSMGSVPGLIFNNF